jgi:hypothetical protein
MEVHTLSIVWYSEQTTAFRKLNPFPSSGGKAGLHVLSCVQYEESTPIVVQ